MSQYRFLACVSATTNATIPTAVRTPEGGERIAYRNRTGDPERGTERLLPNGQLHLIPAADRVERTTDAQERGWHAVQHATDLARTRRARRCARPWWIGGPRRPRRRPGVRGHDHPQRHAA